MRIVKSQFLNLLLISVLFIAHAGCRQKYAVESAAIDSLVVRNSKAMEFLSIDLLTINERKKEMEQQIGVLQKIQPDTTGSDFQMNLEKYKGIYKVYTRFIANYDVIFNQIRQNEKQLSGLKNSLLNEKISAYDYKLALAKESEKVNTTYRDAEAFGHKVYQLEPDYQRISSYFEPLYQSMLKQYPELRPETK